MGNVWLAEQEVDKLLCLDLHTLGKCLLICLTENTGGKITDSLIVLEGFQRVGRLREMKQKLLYCGDQDSKLSLRIAVMDHMKDLEFTHLGCSVSALCQMTTVCLPHHHSKWIISGEWRLKLPWTASFHSMKNETLTSFFSQPEFYFTFLRFLTRVWFEYMLEKEMSECKRFLNFLSDRSPTHGVHFNV